MLNVLRIGMIELHVEMPLALQSQLAYFLSPVITEAQSTGICISIRYCKKLPVYEVSSFEKVRFKNIDYFYDCLNEVYYAINEFAYGRIDFKGESCTWLILETFCNVRSIFHTCILDPISLLGVNYGFLILHASVIGIEKNGIVFMGKSGAGKSTISMLVEKQSSEFCKYSDDTVQVFFDSENIRVIPLYTGEGYFNFVVEKYMNSNNQNIPKIVIGEKQYFFPQKEPTILDLKLIFLLNKNEHVLGSKLLSKREALIELLNLQTHIAGPHLKAWFESMKRLSAKIPIFEQQYNDLCDVNEVMGIINENVLRI